MNQIDPLLVQVAERIRARAGVTAVPPPANLLEWSKRYRRLEGQPFTLDRFKPLEAIYADDHPNIVIKKPAQRGVSEWAVSLTCFALEHGARLWANGLKNGLNIGYLFPVKQDLEDFAKERINELKEESTHLATLFSDEEFDSLGFKKVGKSHLYMRGTYAKSGLLSFPADMIVFDEFDQMDTKAVSLATRRMAASVVRRNIKISTPTFPGKGISAAYLSSDQRIYQTECPRCHEWVSFDFFRDIYCDGEPYDAWKHWSQDRVAMTTVTLHCPNCHEAISDEARCAAGRWHIQNPDNTRVHGYHVPWWPFPMVDLLAFAMAAVSDIPTEVEELHRSDLGLEYGAGGGSVTEEMLAKLCVNSPTDPRQVQWRNTTLGCDIGARLHFRVSSEDQFGVVHVREMGDVETWPELDHLMLRYQVRQAIIDAEPELHEAINFCNRWKGRAMRAFYPSNANALKGVMFNIKQNLRKNKTSGVVSRIATDIQINRTMAMDAVLGQIAGGHECWPKEIAHDREVIDHMIAPTRVKVSDDTGQTHYTWVHTTPDHMFHACVYDVIARQTMPKGDNSLPAVGGERTVVTAYAQHSTNRRERTIEQMRPGRVT